jgi:hypothetical protein
VAQVEQTVSLDQWYIEQAEQAVEQEIIQAV